MYDGLIEDPVDEIWGGGCQSLGLARLFAGDCPVREVVGWAGSDTGGRNGGDLHNDLDRSLGGARKSNELKPERMRRTAASLSLLD